MYVHMYEEKLRILDLLVGRWDGRKVLILAPLLAVEPAVSHMLSWRKEPASELCNRRHISDPFETPHLHCEQHSLLRVNLGPRLHHSDHQHRLCLASGPQEDLSSQVTGHRPEFQVLCRTTCACVHHFCASPFSSNSRTTQ